MGTSTPMKFLASGQVMTPEECSAEILRQLVSQALLETNGSEISGTAITIHAAFNQMQSEATLRAAAAAGLDRVVLLQEPIAAAMAQVKNNSGQFLVYDSAVEPSILPSFRTCLEASTSSATRESTCWAVRILTAS
jgi:molecular chaperone DnaK